LTIAGSFALVLALLVVGWTVYTQASLDAEVTRDFDDLRATANRVSAEELADIVDRRASRRPNLIVELAQRNKVTTVLGREEYQTHWRAGTLRFMEWPDPDALIEPAAVPNHAGAAHAAVNLINRPLVSDWIKTTGFKQVPGRGLLEIRVRGRYVYFPPRSVGGEPGLLLLVGRDMQADEAILRPVKFAAIGSAIAVPIFVLMSAFFTAVFVVRRLDAIYETSTNIIRGNLNERVPVSKRGDEFDRLSETLNRMLDQIQRLITGMKEVSDNIAHDLRTPLFRLRARIELALIDVDADKASEGPREALEVALKEAERLLATFNALLSIARLEAGVMRDNLAAVDVADIVRDVSELYEPAAEDRGLHLTTSAPPGLVIRCNRELIVQALSNLVDNALKYSPVGTTVTLAARLVHPARDQRQIEIAVSDEGPGIPAEDRASVLKRFVRLDRGRGAPGSGLGLALVAAITQLHEAELTLDEGPNGRGLAVRITFPTD
jgi:signal transduction histidine kinase